MGVAEIFSLIQIKPELIVAIIGVSQYIKKLDRNKKVKVLYPIIPLVMSLLVGLMLSNLVLIDFFTLSFSYLGVSVLCYETIIRTLNKAVDKISVDKSS